LGITLLCALSIMPSTAKAAEEIRINEQNFPDSNFRAVLETTYDRDHNKILSPEEMSAMEIFNVSGRNITNLQGIKLLPDVKYLHCDNNFALSTLDLSGTKIELVSVSGCNTLKTITAQGLQSQRFNVSSAENVEKIDLAGSAIETLSITRGNNLASLDVSNCALTRLDCNLTCPNLKYLNCSDNAISNTTGELAIENCSLLEEIDCSENKLTSLAVPSSVRILDCSENILETLSISGNSNLQSLNCSNNQLKQLDVAGNSELKELSCDNNLLGSLDVSNNFRLEKLDCSNNSLSALDVSANTSLKGLSCGNNRLSVLHADHVADISAGDQYPNPVDFYANQGKRIVYLTDIIGEQDAKRVDGARGGQYDSNQYALLLDDGGLPSVGYVYDSNINGAGIGEMNVYLNFADRRDYTYDLKIEGGIKVPPSLTGNTTFNTVQKIETALESEIIKTIPDASIRYFDVTMLVDRKKDGGWRAAEWYEIPEDGVNVTLPFAQTGESKVLIAHLKTDRENGGRDPEIEVFTPEVTEGGAKVKVDSLSPFALGWGKDSVDPKPVETPSGTGDQPQQGLTSPEKPATDKPQQGITSSTSSAKKAPPTGDTEDMPMFLLVLCAAFLCIVICMRYMRVKQ